MENRDVLISGASVAGPALAYWLRRFGFNPTVVERSPQLRAGGYAVDFRGPAHLSVLRRMGLLDEVRRRQTHLSALTYVDANGNRVAGMPAEFFAGDVEILRGDLAAVLYQATQQDTEYLFDDSISGLEEHPDGVQVTFERAAPHRFDLVIGADGVHSTVRNTVFGTESRFIRDTGLYVSIFTTTNFLDLRRTGLLHSVPGKTASIYSHPEPDKAIVMLTFTSPANGALAAAGFADRDVNRQKEIVAETFANMGWRVPEMLRQMWPATDFYLDSTTQIHLDRWHHGRVALIGDAGYAAGPGGNGTGTAVVAAYVLAGELAAAGGDYQVAFPRYEQVLREYVAGNQKQASGGSDFLAPATWKKIHQRDRFFKMLPYLPIKGLIRRMSGRTASAIKLPEYTTGLIGQEGVPH